MARTLRIRKDGDAHYHVMSRTNNKLFLFGKGQFKRTMVELLERAAAWDCPATVQGWMVDIEGHPRMDDLLETMRRWEDVRARKWLTRDAEAEGDAQGSDAAASSLCQREG